MSDPTAEERDRLYLVADQYRCELYRLRVLGAIRFDRPAFARAIVDAEKIVREENESRHHRLKSRVVPGDCVAIRADALLGLAAEMADLRAKYYAAQAELVGFRFWMAAHRDTKKEPSK